MDAPKNIWTDWRAANDASVAFDHPPENDGEGYRTKYILAAEHERLLSEARNKALEDAARRLLRCFPNMGMIDEFAAEIRALKESPDA